MNYCISICCSTVEETIEKLIQISDKSQYIELRLDKIRNPEMLLIILKGYYPLFQKLIVTIRNKSNGGRFQGTENQRINILKLAYLLKFPFIDLEYDVNEKELRWFLDGRSKNGSKIILSYHNFSKTPKNIFSIYKKMNINRPNLIKICTFAKTIEDNLKVLDLVKSNSKNSKLITHAMGEKGEISRILCAIKGNFYTYVSLKDSEKTAPGQIPLEKYKSVYYLDRLKNYSKVYGLVGNPVQHSFGYIIHNFAFNKLNLNSVYLNFNVINLKNFLSEFRNTYSGLSITIPYKEDIISMLDFTDDLSEKIKAVNTVIQVKNSLYGYNTDAYGILNALKKKTSLKNHVIVILGSGGSARSALSVLSDKSNKIIILNRNIKNAKNLASEFNCDYGSLDDISEIEYSLLINTTPVGMFPVDDESPVKKKHIKNCIVFDLIYNPLETKLLSFARENGCKTISGFDMFLFQAEKQFQLFTGKIFPFYKYKKQLLNKIANVNKNYQT